jgi:hypothetical protein
VLVLPPFFYKNPSEDGLVAYFSARSSSGPTGPRSSTSTTSRRNRPCRSPCRSSRV